MSFVLLLGMVSSAGAATLLHWQFDGTKEDLFVSDTDIESQYQRVGLLHLPPKSPPDPLLLNQPPSAPD